MRPSQAPAPLPPIRDASPRTATVLQVVLLGLPAFWLIFYLFPPLNHDVAAILYFTERWLKGAVLYRDIVDVNPPLIFVLSIPPVLLGQWTPIGAPVWMVAFTILAIALSFLLLRRTLPLVEAAQQPLTARLLPALALYLMAVVPGEDFAQREHLMLIGALPYLALAAARADGAAPSLRLALLVGVFAGIGFALKPHFVLIPLAVELYVLARRGWAVLRDPAPWAALAAMVFHVLLAVLVTPEYFTDTLPIVFGSYTSISETDTWTLLTGAPLGPTLVALALLSLGAFTLFGSLARVLALFGAAAIFSAVAQGKGWPYHVLPALAATFLLCATMIGKTVDRFLARDAAAELRGPLTVAAAAFMVLLYYEATLLSYPFRKQVDYADAIGGRLENLIEREAPNGKVLVLSPGIYPFFPAVNYTGVDLTMQYLTMWVVQGVYAGCPELGPLYNPPDAMGPAERHVFRSVPNDFARHLPDLLIIDQVPGIPRCRAEAFSYLDYFSRNPLFAKTLERYEPYQSIERYQVWRRVR